MYNPFTLTESGRPAVRSRSSSKSVDCVVDNDHTSGSDDKNTTPTSHTPTGVNRRTAVLFSKKVKNTPKNDKDPRSGKVAMATPVTSGRRPGRPPKAKLAPPVTGEDLASDKLTENSGSHSRSNSSSSRSAASPAATGRKRTASAAGLASDTEPSQQGAAAQQVHKRSVSSSSGRSGEREPSSPTSPLFSIHHKESFLKYRSNVAHGTSDVETESSEMGSTDTDMSDSDSSSQESGSDSGSESRSSSRRHSRKGKQRVCN